jgi:hypothetical protein
MPGPVSAGPGGMLALGPPRDRPDRAAFRMRAGAG